MRRDRVREADMLRRHEAGETLKSIADTYGLTRERVRQIVKRAGGIMPGSGRPQLTRRHRLIGYAGKER
ncbi:sigma factor-like helix-turn-helix DNA-binding protein [Aquamicrobium ahrensii]|uniref:Transcriptional regulator n=1 Tax=Aquamicrobium ahrensii TaxID=469551 RepID=A0ABV2KNQ2_9HYPH